jgi:methionine-rich copper-binding protein CopC
MSVTDRRRRPRHPWRLLATALAATVLAVLVPTAPAAAHNQLIDTAPAKDAVLDEPPAEVALEFVERLDPTYTTIVVTDAQRRTVATSAPEISGARGVVRFTEPLAPGTYTVAYRVVSLDGHPVQGSFRFTVAGEASAATTAPVATPTTPDPTATPATAAEEREASRGVAIAVAVGVGVVALAALAGVLARRRSGNGQR